MDKKCSELPSKIFTDKSSKEYPNFKKWDIVDSSYYLKGLFFDLDKLNTNTNIKFVLVHYDVKSNTRQTQCVHDCSIHIDEENIKYLKRVCDDLKNKKDALKEENFHLLSDNLYYQNKNYQSCWDNVYQFYFFDIILNK